MKLTSIIGARQREMDAWHLAQHPEQVAELLAARDWERLIPFADAIAADVPVQLAATDPALYRTLRKAVTEIHVRGLALNPDALRRQVRRPNRTSAKFP
ncbi:hypothetical protein AW736_02260 [Termitidicoccus mucosus]|uniref:Uncharacterized protein n=2 Tax=Termitidicoccus mucosus TaxID=1184151 RepID=A0A178IP23_9BACT|nr:hypothetical protein AW736_02260 [Opitutaceae bacterium TSB47]